MYLHQTIHFTLRFIGLQNDVLLTAFSLIVPLLFLQPLAISIDFLTEKLRLIAAAQRKRA